MWKVFFLAKTAKRKRNSFPKKWKRERERGISISIQAKESCYLFVGFIHVKYSYLIGWWDLFDWLWSNRRNSSCLSFLFPTVLIGVGQLVLNGWMLCPRFGVQFQNTIHIGGVWFVFWSHHFGHAITYNSSRSQQPKSPFW